MDSKNKDFVDADKFLISTQPLYGLRREEMLKKIGYLKQKLFWTMFSNRMPAKNISLLHKQLFRDLFSKDEIIWKEHFEKVLENNKITFKPGNLVYENGVMDLVGNVDAHLCSGPYGDWSSVGLGLKVISSQKEREIYIEMTEKFLFKHKFCLFFNFPSPDYCDPLVALKDLEHGFNEDFGLDSLIVCSKDLYNQEISSLRITIETLESYIFWGSFYNFETALTTRISRHKLAFQQKNLKTIIMEKKDIDTEWLKEFERLLASYSLTFAPGKAKRTTIGNSCIQMDKNIDAHLCSGIKGKWNSHFGFGGLMIIDKASRKNYLRFIE